MEIIKQSESPLLKRKRIVFVIDHTLKATPSKKEIIKKIAESQKTKEDLVAIRHIYNKFGSSQSKIIVHIYKDKETLLNLEPKKHHPKEEEKKPEEKPAEAPKPEEKKEEPSKQEVKPEKTQKEETKPAEAPKEETPKETKE